MRCRLGAFIATLLLLMGCAAAALSADEKNEPRRFVLEVKSQVTGAELRLRGAIGYDGQLELIEAATPFTKEIEAVGLTALFAVVDSDGSVIAVGCPSRHGQLTWHQ